MNEVINLTYVTEKKKSEEKDEESCLSYEINKEVNGYLREFHISIWKFFLTRNFIREKN